MMIHEVTEKAGKYKARKRVGRGRGSGIGKTSGRGHKGAGSRAGYSARHQFEGGQMPYFRRHSKRGFTNVQFTTEFWCVNIGDVVKHPDFASGGKLTSESLLAAHLIRDDTRPVKLLGDLRGAEKIGQKFEVDVERVTKSVRAAIEAAGGSVNERGTRRDVNRGIDRNSEDLTPKNLTKKLRRGRQAGGGEGGKGKKKKK